MEIEKANAADIEELAALRLQYLREDHGELDAEEADTIQRLLPAYFQKHLNKDLFAFILREEKRIVSCAFLLVVEKPMSPAFLNGRTGVVLNVYTRPEYRRSGYAGRVMKALVKASEELGLCTVELKATEAGYALYRSVGFADDLSHYRLMKWRHP